VFALLKALADAPALAAHSDFHPFAQGLDHRDAHPVQTAGHLVAATAELAAGVSASVQHRFHGPLAGAGDGLSVGIGRGPLSVTSTQPSSQRRTKDFVARAREASSTSCRPPHKRRCADPLARVPEYLWALAARSSKPSLTWDLLGAVGVARILEGSRSEHASAMAQRLRRSVESGPRPQRRMARSAATPIGEIQFLNWER